MLALTSRINAECLEKAIGCWNRVKAGMIAHDAALRNCFENSLRLLAQCGGICHVQLEEAERFLGLLLELLKTKGVGSAIISLNLVYDFLLSLSQVSAEVERLVRTTRQQFANLTEVQKDAAVMEAVEQKIISCNTECL